MKKNCLVLFGALVLLLIMTACPSKEKEAIAEEDQSDAPAQQENSALGNQVISQEQSSNLSDGKESDENSNSNPLGEQSTNALSSLSLEARLSARRNSPSKHWYSVAVWVIDDFGSFEGHGRAVESLIKKNFHGAVKPFDAGNYAHEGGQLSGSRIAFALESIIDWGIEFSDAVVVVNMSWGSASYDGNLEELFKFLGDYGFIFVAAAGNDGRGDCSYPAGYKSVISVSSVVSDSYGHFVPSQYANFGRCVDVAVRELDVENIERIFMMKGRDEITRLITQTGTSFSAAQATGVIADKISRDLFRPLPNEYKAFFISGGSAGMVLSYPNVKVLDVLR